MKLDRSIRTCLAVCFALFPACALARFADSSVFGTPANGLRLGIAQAPIDSNNPVSAALGVRGFLNVPILLSLRNDGTTTVTTPSITQDFDPKIVDAAGNLLPITWRCPEADFVDSNEGPVPLVVAAGKTVTQEWDLWCSASIRSGATYRVTVTARIRDGQGSLFPVIATLESNAIEVSVP